jgi:hypothetical protein
MTDENKKYCSEGLDIVVHKWGNLIDSVTINGQAVEFTIHEIEKKASL